MSWYQAQTPSVAQDKQINPVEWDKIGQESGAAFKQERELNEMKKAYRDAEKRPETSDQKAMQDQLWNLQVELVRLEKYLPQAKQRGAQARAEGDQLLRTTPDTKMPPAPVYSGMNDRTSFPMPQTTANPQMSLPNPLSSIQTPAWMSQFGSNAMKPSRQMAGYQPVYPNAMTGYQPNRGKY